jgi:histidinol-phosphate aminotransferase
MPPPSPQPAARAANARSYARHDRPQPISLRLDANEGPPPPAALLQIIREVADDPTLTHTYPDLRGLEADLADRHGLRADSVLVTAGADDSLGRTAQSLLQPGRRALLTRPTFEMIERYIAQSGAEAVAVPWLGGPFPIADLLAAARTADPAAIYVVSPNNPTGGVATADHLRALSAAHPAALLVVDQAYAEFGGEDLTSAALALPNAVVTRTFSKAWGLAGLRVGYALGPANIIAWMRAMGQPYPVSAIAAAAARRWLREGESFMHGFVERIRSERERLTPLLRTLGGEPIESHANLVLCRFNDAASIASRLADAGIAVREYPNHPILKDYLRIGLPGDEQAFTTLTTALREAMTTST